MRIIKLPNEKEHSCDECTCKFAYNDYDTFKESFFSEDGTYESDYTCVYCPNCGKIIKLKSICG